MPIQALCCTAAGLVLSTLMALWMPKSLFEYVTTAGSLVLMYTWLLICITYIKKMKPVKWNRIKVWIAIVFIVAAVAGTAMEKPAEQVCWQVWDLWCSLGLSHMLFIRYVARNHRSQHHPNHKQVSATFVEVAQRINECFKIISSTCLGLASSA